MTKYVDRSALIERINQDARTDAFRYWLDPSLRERIADIQSINFANLHDSSCVGRVCLNPSHMPGEGKAIDVTPAPELNALIPSRRRR